MALLSIVDVSAPPVRWLRRVTFEKLLSDVGGRECTASAVVATALQMERHGTEKVDVSAPPVRWLRPDRITEDEYDLCGRECTASAVVAT